MPANGRGSSGRPCWYSSSRRLSSSLSRLRCLPSRSRPHSPIRCARAVMKMPLGFCAGRHDHALEGLRCRRRAAGRASRTEIQTSSPRGLNSMCSTPWPGLQGLDDRAAFGTSMTCTVSLSGKAKLTQTWRPSGRAMTNTGWPCTGMRPTSLPGRQVDHQHLVPTDRRHEGAACRRPPSLPGAASCTPAASGSPLP